MTLLKTKAQRRLYWKTIDRLQANVIRRTTALVLDQLKRDKNKAALAVSNAQPQFMAQASTSAIAGQADEWLELLNKIYIMNFEIFGARVFAQFQKAAIDLVPPEIRARWAQLATEFVRTTASAAIPEMLSTTNKAIQRSIAQGVEEGLGTNAIGQLIRERQPGIGVNRAKTIARTEVVSASNLGSLTGAASVDPTMLKEWIATPDSRTRSTHVSADGQTRRLQDPFNVGGFAMMFPGDTSLGAPPSETINERCTLAYLPNPIRTLTGMG